MNIYLNKVDLDIIEEVIENYFFEKIKESK